jgi:hypothetical protein
VDSYRALGLLVELEADLGDSTTSLTTLLQKCLLLGGTGHTSPTPRRRNRRKHQRTKITVDAALVPAG